MCEIEDKLFENSGIRFFSSLIRSVMSVGEIRNVYKILIAKPEGRGHRKM
jgi:hypothetical protein